MTRALFLDRDGTLIVDVGYPRNPDQVALLPGAAAALRMLPEDVALVIVTNQSGLGRGLISTAEAAAVATRVNHLFAAEGVRFAATYTCPHRPEDACPCRKPAPGMLHAAARDFGIELTRSILVGDKPSDVDAGRAAGCLASLRFAVDNHCGADVVGWDAASRRIASIFGLE